MSRLFSDDTLKELVALRAHHEEAARVHAIYAAGKGLSGNYKQAEEAEVAFHRAAVLTLSLVLSTRAHDA